MHHSKKISHGRMPPNPSSKVHGFAKFAMSSMSRSDMQISKSEKNHSCPPLPNPGYTPEGQQ